MLKDTMIRYQLDFNNCRRQSYDGASNMAGKYITYILKTIYIL